MCIFYSCLLIFTNIYSYKYLTRKVFAYIRKLCIFAQKFSYMANKELRIKDICKEKNITLEALASKLNIRRTSLAQAMSRNNFSIDKLAEIANALGVEIPDLFHSSLANSSISGECPHCGKRIFISITSE